MLEWVDEHAHGVFECSAASLVADATQYDDPLGEVLLEVLKDVASALDQAMVQYLALLPGLGAQLFGLLEQSELLSLLFKLLLVLFLLFGLTRVFLGLGLCLKEGAELLLDRGHGREWAHRDVEISPQDDFLLGKVDV